MIFLHICKYIKRYLYKHINRKHYIFFLSLWSSGYSWIHDPLASPSQVLGWQEEASIVSELTLVEKIMEICKWRKYVILAVNIATSSSYHSAFPAIMNGLYCFAYVWGDILLLLNSLYRVLCHNKEKSDSENGKSINIPEWVDGEKLKSPTSEDLLAVGCCWVRESRVSLGIDSG